MESDNKDSKNILPHWIKERQSKEERSYKYRLCVEMGLCRLWALRLRDWTWNHLILYLVNNSKKAAKIFSKAKIGNYDFSQVKSIYPITI